MKLRTLIQPVLLKSPRKAKKAREEGAAAEAKKALYTPRLCTHGKMSCGLCGWYGGVCESVLARGW